MFDSLVSTPCSLPRMREKRSRATCMLLTGAPLELPWRNITEPAVTTMAVIPPLDPRENLSTCFVSRLKAVSIQHFRLQAREERLHHRVIEAIADATHGTRDSQLSAARGECHGR